MIKRGDQTTCIFCQKTFQAGKRGEDVIPNWYAKHLGHPSGVVQTLSFDAVFGNESTSPRNSQTVAASEFRLHSVCPNDCNGDWMSQVENDARLPLLRMMAGESTTVETDELEAVVQWAQLKAVCWDALKSEPAFEQTHRSALHARRPLRWATSASWVESDGPMDITIGRNHGFTEVRGLDEIPRIVRTSIVFDQLMLRVTVDLDGTLPPELLMQTDGGQKPLWPIAAGSTLRPLNWPPETQLSKKSYLSTA